MDRDVLIQAGTLLSSWQRTMILTHDRPDGDGLGSMAGIKRVIDEMGTQATAFVYDHVPTIYQFLAESCEFTLWKNVGTEKLDAQFDGILILDTCSWQQLEPVADYLKASSFPRIVIDHHQTRDELTSNGSSLYVIDPTASSASLMVYTLCEAMNWSIDAIAAQGLFAGISTDTGWFRFSNTDSQTLQAAAGLIEKGIRPDRMYSLLYASCTLERLRLMSETLGTLELHGNGALAVMQITQDMFEGTGAQRSDTENIVNAPMEAASVIVSVLLVDMGDGKIRINFRSKAPEVVGREVDVSAIAAQFDGGGHARAAGARVEGTLDNIREQVIASILRVLDNSSIG